MCASSWRGTVEAGSRKHMAERFTLVRFPQPPNGRSAFLPMNHAEPWSRIAAECQHNLDIRMVSYVFDIAYCGTYRKNGCYRCAGAAVKSSVLIHGRYSPKQSERDGDTKVAWSQATSDTSWRCRSIWLVVKADPWFSVCRCSSIGSSAAPVMRRFGDRGPASAPLKITQRGDRDFRPVIVCE